MGNETKPYAAWGSLGILMRKDKRFVVAVYLSVGGILLLLVLYPSTSGDFFRWLFYLLLAILIAIGIGGEIMSFRNRLQHRNRKK